MQGLARRHQLEHVRAPGEKVVVCFAIRPSLERGNRPAAGAQCVQVVRVEPFDLGSAPHFESPQRTPRGLHRFGSGLFHVRRDGPLRGGENLALGVKLIRIVVDSAERRRGGSGRCCRDHGLGGGRLAVLDEHDKGKQNAHAAHQSVHPFHFHDVCHDVCLCMFVVPKEYPAFLSQSSRECHPAFIWRKAHERDAIA